ncbi:MAG: FAD-dependent oxidoreductase [Chloroflexota bacterium]|nr:FAD-dependent oxidoreductase [Dehalococcoidia bacterium]MDW8253030.1 FAD-dependent oxidoreductase [Chloroflexota bacterium]
MRAVVVGAGIAGLLAGHTLRDAGISVLLFEAGPVPGGRLATRQTAAGAADIGAQFFTVRDQRFQQLVEAWERAGLVRQWSSGFSDGARPPEDGFPRYVVRGGMRALAAYLAQSLEVRLGQRVRAIAAEGGRWRVQSDSGETVVTDGVVLTPPLPAALPLVAGALPAGTYRQLAAVRYRRTLSAVVTVEESVLPPPGAVQRPNDRLAFVADNQRKGLASAPVLTIHASPEWSDALWPLDDEAVLARLIAAAQPYFRGTPRDAILDRWPFALPEPVLPERAVAVGTLLFAGDAFAGPRVEGAALSGLAAGDHLSALLAASGA